MRQLRSQCHSASNRSIDFSLSSRIKRRAQVFVANDENADPNTLPHGTGDLDENGTELVSSTGKRNFPSVKRALGGQRVALSPRKANGQNSIYEESRTGKLDELDSPYFI